MIKHTINAPYRSISEIIWSVWLNGGVFVYELSDCGFELCQIWRLFRARMLDSLAECLTKLCASDFY